jgi:glycosyltransferase involved in cell wall biosynthesis
MGASALNTGPAERPPISVVVPTRDRPALLDECLTTLVAVLGPEDEVIVADSASSDPAVATVATAHGARLVRCDRPGASVARNAGWRAARHDLVAFIDDDVRVTDDWPDTVTAVFATYPDLAFLTGRVDVPPHQQGTARPVAITDDDEAVVIDTATGGTVGQSANMAARRSALEKVDGFDEQLGPGGPRGAVSEDVDLYDRLLANGCPGRYEPSVRAFHVQWRARGALVRVDWHYGLGAGFRVAKLVRTDRRRAGPVARQSFWRWGLHSIWAALRQRYASGVVYAAVRLAGMVVGLAQGLFTPIRNGHFLARRTPS